MTDTVRDNIEVEVQKEILAKKKHDKLERKLDEWNHTMELIRTMLSFAGIVLQLIILYVVLNR